MAGVAGPRLRSDRGGGIRLLVGLSIGGVLGGLILAVPAYLLGVALRAVTPLEGRLWALAVACALLGLADLTGRTPHVWRQVPQMLVHRLPPGRLGLAWGFDLGLLFTTQKVVSLIWAALAAVILLEPAMAADLLVGLALIASAATAAWTVRERTPAEPMPRWERAWQTRVRRTSGLVLLVGFTVVAFQAATM